MGANIAATPRHNYFLSHKTKLLEFYELVRNDLFDIKAALKLKHYCLTDRMSSCFNIFYLRRACYNLYYPVLGR